MGEGPIFARLVNTCWWFFKVALSGAAILVAVVGVYLFYQLDEQIRVHVESMLAERMPNVNVSVGGARWVENQGVAVYDVVISETGPGGRQENILFVEEMLVACDVTLDQLSQGSPEITAITLRHPQLWVNRRADGRWNVQSIWPLPETGGKQPPVEVRSATITVTDSSRPNLAPLVLRDVNLQAKPVAQSSAQPTVEIPPEILSEVGPAPPVTDRAIQVVGYAAGVDLKSAQFSALVDPQQAAVSIAARFEALEVANDLGGWLAAYAGESLGQARFRGQIDGEIACNASLKDGTPPRVAARLRVSNGQLNHPRLPRTVSSITARIACRPSGITVDALYGNLGPAAIRLSLQHTGWGPGWTATVAAAVDGLPLDESLRKSLPPEMLESWKHHQPEGIIDVEAHVSLNQHGWRPDVTVRGRELTFLSDKYTYRAREGSGTMHLYLPQGAQQQRLDIDLTAIAGGKPVRITGFVNNPGPASTGAVEIRGEALLLEQPMIDAIQNPKAREVINSLHASGRMNVYIRAERNEPFTEFTRQLRIEVIDGALNYEHFPYPLSGITGVATAVNDDWKFIDFVSSGSKVVRCGGSLIERPAGHELQLQFNGQKIPFDLDLQQALPESIRMAWEQLRPRGNAGFRALVQRPPGVDKPNISVTVMPDPETASVRPVFFDYQFENLSGEVSYRDGTVVLRRLRAEHGPTEFRTQGLCDFRPDGSWEVRLDGVTADRVLPRRGLESAIPPTLRKTIEMLQPQGTFSLHDGVLSFSKAAGPAAPVLSRWDISIGCLQAQICAGIDISNCHGSVRLQGESNPARAYTNGELNLETATVQDVQLTDVTGPFFADESGVWLGRSAAYPGRTATPIRAVAYGGAVDLSGHVSLDGIPYYECGIDCRGVDLERLIIERFAGQRRYPGKMDGHVTLRGSGASMTTLTGEGNLHVHDANIYELPLLVSLLKVLRNKSPDTTAFNQSIVQFRMQGQHIYLDKLYFLGDAVSLYGSGYTNLDQELKLEFSGSIGRNDQRIPFWRNVMGRASQGMLRMYVDGTVSNPQVSTQAFPGFLEMIEQIQNDFEVPAATAPRNAGRSLPSTPRFGRR